MPTLRRLRPLLGCLVEIGLAGPAVDGNGDATAIDAAYAGIADIERRLSFHRADSELSRLNQNRGRWLALSAHSLRVLRLARGMTRLSGGLYNATLGGAMVRRGLLPDHGGKIGLEVGGAEDIEIAEGRARLQRGVHLTVDGIAKGYAVDIAVAELRRRGQAAGWVNAGGDLRVFGRYRLPVSRRSQDGSILPLGELQDGAIASSGAGGDLARSQAGTLLDRQGLPIQAGDWSVIAASAWRADALTKVAAQYSLAQKLELLPRLGGRWIEALPAAQMGAAA